MELFDYEKDHLARVREGLAECMVLLRTNGAFPLEKAGTLAAFGNGIRYGVKGGSGSGDVNAHVIVGIEQGLVDAGFQITSTAWLDAYDKRRVQAKNDFRKQLKREAKAAGEMVILYGFMLNLGSFYLDRLTEAIRSRILELNRGCRICTSPELESRLPIGAAAEMFTRFLRRDDYQWVYSMLGEENLQVIMDEQ